jgi:hypothetical protein
MNVEIGTEAALFPEKEYINGIAVAVCRKTEPPIASRFRRLDAAKLALAKPEFLQLEKGWNHALIKKKIKFLLYIRKFRRDRLQSHM